MLSYLHGFHAGNHADILKHCVLVYTLNYLNRKNKPYSFFDTHAGSGLYDFYDEKALKTGEASKGILKLLETEEKFPEKIPEELKPYLLIVKKFSEKNLYPGSPVIETELKMPESPLFLTELHKTEFEKLQQNLKTLYNEKETTIRKIFTKNISGWENLKSSTPPEIKRGAVLCDPSYEELSDYEKTADILSSVHRKWNAATILLWYPLLSYRTDIIEEMKQQIFSSAKNINGNTEVLDIQLTIDQEDSHQETDLKNAIGSEKPRLYGSGMLVVNPCWGLKENMEKILPAAAEILGKDGKGSWCCQFMEV